MLYRERSKYPPAEPEALRLLAPQRGLFATAWKQLPKLRDAGDANHAHRGSVKSDMRPFRVLVPAGYTPGSVKL
jgi:hypothetical protein